MLLYLALCISLLDGAEVSSFLLRDSYSVELTDDAVYHIKESVDDDDAILDRRRSGARYLDDKGEQRQFNKLASDESNNRTYTEPAAEFTIATPKALKHRKSFITNRTVLKSTAIREYDDRNYSLYDYDELVGEYDEETFMESDPKAEVIISIKDIVTLNMENKNCTAEELSQIGLKAVYCLYSDYKNDRQNPKVLAGRLWRIARIWFYVYLAVAVPFFCTKGWCCCCLFCKFFKPRQTIEEARLYLSSSPPGVLHTEKGGTTFYEPTEREIEKYEELEHFIQTV